MVMKRMFISGTKLGSHLQRCWTKATLILFFFVCLCASSLSAQSPNDLATYPGRPNYGALKYSSSQSWFNYLMLWQHQRDDQRQEEFQQALASREAMQSYIATVRQKMRQLAGSFPERGNLESRTVALRSRRLSS